MLSLVTRERREKVRGLVGKILDAQHAQDFPHTDLEPIFDEIWTSFEAKSELQAYGPREFWLLLLATDDDAFSLYSSRLDSWQSIKIPISIDTPTFLNELADGRLLLGDASQSFADNELKFDRGKKIVSRCVIGDRVFALEISGGLRQARSFWLTRHDLTGTCVSEVELTKLPGWNTRSSWGGVVWDGENLFVLGFHGGRTVVQQIPLEDGKTWPPDVALNMCAVIWDDARFVAYRGRLFFVIGQHVHVVSLTEANASPVKFGFTHLETRLFRLVRVESLLILAHAGGMHCCDLDKDQADPVWEVMSAPRPQMLRFSDDFLLAAVDDKFLRRHGLAVE